MIPRSFFVKIDKKFEKKLSSFYESSKKFIRNITKIVKKIENVEVFRKSHKNDVKFE